MVDEKTIEEIQDNEFLASAPQRVVGGGIYLPPTLIPSPQSNRILEIMELLETDDPRLVVSSALELLDWALGQWENGLQPGALNTEQGYGIAAVESVTFLQQLNEKRK